MSAALTQLHPDATSVFKDSYLLDFLSLPENYSERDLQKSLLANLKKFLIELGPDFCFAGEEFRLQVGGQDFVLDLLFYHRGLGCLVAFDLKTDKFKPEFLGKMEFYLEALDRDVRKPHDRANLEKATKDIVARRREIQFAADAAWPHTNKTNAGIRTEFKLPTDRALT